VNDCTAKEMTMGTTHRLSVKARSGQLIMAVVAALLIGVGLMLLVNSAPDAPSAMAKGANPEAGPVASSPLTGVAASGDKYVVLAWNDLGMHCYNRDFQNLAVLPPYNTLWAQVIQMGNPPQVVTSGITLTYVFTDNAYSVGKSNFWTYDQQLFGVNLPNNVGLKGKGLSGTMDLHGDHFVAEGIPLTEFPDSAPNTPYPYQLSTIIVRDTGTNAELARATVVAPVSTEMHCDYCHNDHGIANPNIATGSVEQNILTVHEDANLMSRRPVLCASCHASNALGMPGRAGLPSLSHAMHSTHASVVHPGLTGCYSCHPGPRTQCLRDVMAQNGMDCTNCHGSVATVAQNPNPWLNEPRCDNASCHGSGYAQDQPLYRNSKGHGGVYCEGCHDSPHAIAPSRQPNDNIKFIDLQGDPGTLRQCTVCHTIWPTGAGPHGLVAPPVRSFSLSPNGFTVVETGTQVIYSHVLRNTGSLSDTYDLDWSSSQGWAGVTGSAGGIAFTLPCTVTLDSNQTALITATVNVPGVVLAHGTLDVTIITATSTISPELAASVTDRTAIISGRVYLPIIVR
jgi:hypothetical protein